MPGGRDGLRKALDGQRVNVAHDDILTGSDYALTLVVLWRFRRPKNDYRPLIERAGVNHAEGGDAP